jgi:hypothetical protein
MQLQVRSATRIRPTGRSRPHADVPTNPAASLATPPMHVTGRTPARNNSRPAQIHPAPKSKRFPSLALAQLPYPPPPPTRSRRDKPSLPSSHFHRPSPMSSSILLFVYLFLLLFPVPLRSAVYTTLLQCCCNCYSDY